MKIQYDLECGSLRPWKRIQQSQVPRKREILRCKTVTKFGLSAIRLRKTVGGAERFPVPNAVALAAIRMHLTSRQLLDGVEALLPAYRVRLFPPTDVR
jgi:hypothetical protein